MSQTVNVNFRMDADLKKAMESVCEEMGMSMTTAFNIYAKRVARDRRIPFDVSADPFYSDSNIQYLENILRDIQSGRANFSKHELVYADDDQ